MAWTDPPAFTAVATPVSDFNTYLRDNLLAQGEAQRHIWIDPLDTDAQTGGGAWTTEVDLTAPVDPYGYGVIGNAVGNYLEYIEYLTPGTWLLNIHSGSSNNCGVVDVTITENATSTVVATASFNFYYGSASISYGPFGPTDLAIPRAGLYTIRLEITGKDIHSSDYFVRIFSVGLQKTVDLATSPVVWTTPRTWSATYVSAADLETHMRDNLRMSGPQRKRYYIDPWSYAAASGAVVTLDVTQALGFFADFTTQNQTMEWDVVLPVGDITVTLLGEKANNRGNAHVIWDGVDKGSVDFYNAATQPVQRGSVSWTNATPQKARLQIKNASKNGSSSAYQLHISRIAIISTVVWSDPQHMPAQALVSVADLNAGWRDKMRVRGEMPWLIDIDPVSCAPVAQNSWTRYEKKNTTLYFTGLATVETEYPGLEGFWIEWDVALAAGTYEISVAAGQDSNAGQMDVLLDGTEVMNDLEYYHATLKSSRVNTSGGHVVSTTKVYRVRVRINSKNASSSDYYGSLNRLRFRRTS